MLETQEQDCAVDPQAELDALIEEARQRARRRRLGYLALAATALGIVAFGVSRFDGGSGAGGEIVRGGDAGSSASGSQANTFNGNELCLKMPALQIAGGVELAGIDQAREGSGLQADRDNSLAGPLRAFEKTLQSDLRNAQRVGGSVAEPTVAAAQSALQRVKSNPEILLRENDLNGLFAEAQTRAEQAGLSKPNCFPPPGA